MHLQGRHQLDRRGQAEGLRQPAIPATDTNAARARPLPASLFTPVASPQGGNGSPLFVVVADVTYTWSPAVFTGLLNAVTLKRSSYINPRYVSSLKYTAGSGDDGFGQACSGY